MLEIKLASTNKQLREFINLHYRLSKKHSNWSPMIYSESKNIVLKEKSPLLGKNSHEFYLAYRDGVPVGRICVGADKDMNEHKCVKHAFFTLFDCEDDEEAANLLLSTAEKWATDRGYEYLKGPISPTNGDDNRGILTDGFDKMNAILNNYNPEYYARFFEGYDKYLEYYAYEFSLKEPIEGRKLELMKKVVEKYSPEFKDFDDTEALLEETFSVVYGKEGLEIKSPDFKKKKVLYRQLEKIFMESMPDIWEEDLFPPEYEEIVEMVDNFIKFTTPEMVQAAYMNDEMIGFAATVPEASKVIKKCNGRIFPFGWISFLIGMKKPKKVRAVLLFISEKYGNLGLSGAFIINLRKSLMKIGVEQIEFSTISSKNKQMTNVANFLDLKKYKTYTIFGKNVTQKKLDLKNIYGMASKKFERIRSE